MTKEYKSSALMVLATVIVLVIGFSFPPIISREGDKTPKLEHQTIAKNERSYCRKNLDDVNCNCFAKKAAHMLVQDQPDIHGFTYADRTDLARGQASTRC